MTVLCIRNFNFFLNLYFLLKHLPLLFFERKIFILHRLNCILFKTLDTIGNCQRPVFSLGVSQHMHKITNLWKFELNRSCFQMVDFETSNSKSKVSKSNWWKINSFSRTTSLQREPFLTMFYTINLSPLLVTKKGFVLIIILSNYQ